MSELVISGPPDEKPHGRFKKNRQGVPMSKSDKKKRRIRRPGRSQSQSAVSKLSGSSEREDGEADYQGRFGHPGEKRPTRARMEDSQLGGRIQSRAFDQPGRRKQALFVETGKVRSSIVLHRRPTVFRPTARGLCKRRTALRRVRASSRSSLRCAPS